MIEWIPFQDLILDPKYQFRGGTDAELVVEYGGVLESQGPEALPPVKVIRIDGRNVVVDGFHTSHAHVFAFREECKIPCEVRTGTERDAILAAATANVHHGRRPCDMTRQRQFRTILTDPEWGAWSDSVVAAKLGCSTKTVSRWRLKLNPATDPDAPRRASTGADGRTRRTPFQAPRADPPQARRPMQPVQPVSVGYPPYRDNGSEPAKERDPFTGEPMMSSGLGPELNQILARVPGAQAAHDAAMAAAPAMPPAETFTPGSESAWESGNPMESLRSMLAAPDASIVITFIRPEESLSYDLAKTLAEGVSALLGRVLPDVKPDRIYFHRSTRKASVRA